MQSEKCIRKTAATYDLQLLIFISYFRMFLLNKLPGCVLIKSGCPYLTNDTKAYQQRMVLNTAASDAVICVHLKSGPHVTQER